MQAANDSLHDHARYDLDGPVALGDEELSGRDRLEKAAPVEAAAEAPVHAPVQVLVQSPLFAEVGLTGAAPGKN